MRQNEGNEDTRRFTMAELVGTGERQWDHWVAKSGVTLCGFSIHRAEDIITLARQVKDPFAPQALCPDCERVKARDWTRGH